MKIQTSQPSSPTKDAKSTGNLDVQSVQITIKHGDPNWSAKTVSYAEERQKRRQRQRKGTVAFLHCLLAMVTIAFLGFVIGFAMYVAFSTCTKGTIEIPKNITEESTAGPVLNF